MRLICSFAQLPNINSGGHFCCPLASFIIPKTKPYICSIFLLLLLNSILARGGSNIADGNGTKQSTKINY